MKRYVICVLLAGLLAATGSAQQKKRVAVLNFDYAAVQSQTAALFGTNIDVGKGIADLLVDKLVRGLAPVARKRGVSMAVRIPRAS